MKTRPLPGSLADKRIPTVAVARRFRRPRFLRELVWVPVEDRIIVDGSDRLHILKPGTNPELLQKLILLMDGSRTVSELESAFSSVPAQDLHVAVSQLSSYGLVEDGDSNPAGIANIQTLSFLRRYVGATRANCNGLEAYERLLRSNVLILASGKGTQDASILQALLKRTGIGRVELLAEEAFYSKIMQNRVLPKDTLVIAASLSAEDYERNAALDEWCFERRISWLHAVVDENANYADIGPVFNGPETPCYRCYHAMHSVKLGCETSPAEHSPALDSTCLLAMLAVEITYLLSRIGPVLSGRDFRRYDLNTGDSKVLRCSRLPDCHLCQPLLAAAPKVGVSASQTTIDTAIIFEDFAGLPSRSLAPFGPPPSEHSMIPLYQSKHLPNCKHWDLSHEVPELREDILEILRSGKASSGRPLTIDDLTVLLLTTAGIRDSQAGITKVKRWAATAGNLGSVELWLAVRCVEGLAPGYYYYQPHHHALAEFHRRAGALEVADFMGRVLPNGSGSLPDVLVFFTGAMGRVAQKYGPFAYRLVNLDAGAAMSQLHLVARCLNVMSETVCRWPDDLIEEQLNLEPFEEHCTGVVKLFGSADADESDRRNIPQPAASRHDLPASAKLPSEFGGLSVQEVLQMAYRESRIKEEELGLRPFAVSAPYMDSAGDEPLVDVAVPLPGILHPGEPVEKVLAGRTSVRHYTHEPVSLDQIDAMLSCAQRGDIRDWPEEQIRGQGLNFFVLAFRAHGLEPGVYRYDPKDRVLRFCGPPPSATETVELFVQHEFAAASLVIWITGNLAGACARHGAFGHRLLLLRSGAASHRLWMAALGMGLAGTIVAGVIPGAARRQLGFDGYKQTSLLAVALGYKAEFPKRPLTHAGTRGNGGL